jgi:Domain of unknown function (DUF4397)
MNLKGRDTINSRQLIHELLAPCIDNQASVVRVFNAVPDSPLLDVYSNDSPRIRYVEYRELTNYIPTNPGERNVKIYSSTDNKLLLEIKDCEIVHGQIITCAIFGSLDNLKFIPIIDDINETVMPDQTKVRFYNLDGSIIAFTFGTNSGSITTDLVSGDGTKYTQINPGNYDLQVRMLNQNTTSKKIKISFSPGKIYTVYIIGSVTSNSPNYSQLNIPQIVLSVDGNTLFNQCIWY